MYEMIESPYGEDAMNRPQIFKYFWTIQVGKKSTDNNGRSSHSCSSRNEKNVQHVQSLMISYRPLCLVQSTKVHRLLKRKSRKKPELSLLQDKTPTHVSILVKQFLIKRQVIFVRNPPYSPNLITLDYVIFSRIKLKMKGSAVSIDRLH